MDLDQQTLAAAFKGKAWREGMDALFDATGLAVSVMGLGTCSVIETAGHCSYCQLAVSESATAPAACFDDPLPDLAAGSIQIGCRAGLSCYVAPITHQDHQVATLVVGGFVSSTRERKRLFERLLAKGVVESEARRIVRSIPVLPRREIEALVDLARISAEETLRRECDDRTWQTRTRELEVFVGASRAFIERRGMGPDLLEAVLERGMSIVCADSGSLMLSRPGTDLLEVVAPRGPAVSKARGRMVRLGEGIAGRVALTGRGVLVSGSADPMLEHSLAPGRDIATSLSVPLVHGGETLGVINLNISDPGRRLSGADLLLIEQYAQFAAAVISNARKHEATERRMYELIQLGGIANTLGISADIEEVLQLASSLLEKAFDIDVGGLVLTGWGRDHATVVLCADVSQSDVEAILAEAAGRDVATDPFESVRFVTHRGDLAQTDACPEWNVMASELMVQGNVVGYAFIAGCGEGLFDSDDRRLLEGLGQHTALALERAAVFVRTRDDLMKTIAALSATLDATEHASPGHADRVMDYAMATGEQMGLPFEEVELLRFAGLLHDIGKTGVAEEILLKPSKLTPEERERVKLHAQIGANIVEQIDFLNAIAPVIMHHHENWDGTGYPMQLAGEDIPLLARILAVADAFDAMTSESPYQKRLSFTQAKAELRSGAGTQFDPGVVDSFLEAMDRRALAGATGLMTPRGDEPQLPA